MESQRFTSGYIGAVVIAAIAYGLSWAIFMALWGSNTPAAEFFGTVVSFIGLFAIFAVFAAFIPFCLARYLAAKHRRHGLMFHILSGALIGWLNSVLIGGPGGVVAVQCTFSGIVGGAFYWWRTGRHTHEISDVLIGETRAD
jgi:hypothetical protein